MDIQMNIFNNVSKKDESDMDNQRANMSAAAAERAKPDEAKDQSVWIESDEVNLADDNLRTTEYIHNSHPSNHLSPIENDNFDGQEKVNPNSRGERGAKRGKMSPIHIKEDQPRSRVT